jgi:hypothetical protein
LIGDARYTFLDEESMSDLDRMKFFFTTHVVARERTPQRARSHAIAITQYDADPQHTLGVRVPDTQYRFTR